MLERMLGMRAIAVLLCIGLVTLARPVGAVTFADEVPFDEAKFAAAQAETKPILVHITASWCSVCATQKQILGELLKEARFKRLVVFNVDFDRQKDLVRRFGARAQSTMVVFKGRKQAGIFSGDTRPKAVALLLSRVL